MAVLTIQWWSAMDVLGCLMRLALRHLINISTRMCNLTPSRKKDPSQTPEKLNFCLSSLFLLQLSSLQSSWLHKRRKSQVREGGRVRGEAGLRELIWLPGPCRCNLAHSPLSQFLNGENGCFSKPGLKNQACDPLKSSRLFSPDVE